MHEVTTMEFVDVETKQSAVAVIRAGKGVVGLALSTKDDGDVEVFLSPEDCRKLAGELETAIRSTFGDS